MDTAQEVYFSDSTLLGYGITGAVYIMLPVIAFYIMHRYNAARLWHVIVGVVTYFISTRLSDACVLRLPHRNRSRRRSSSEYSRRPGAFSR